MEVRANNRLEKTKNDKMKCLKLAKKCWNNNNNNSSDNGEWVSKFYNFDKRITGNHTNQHWKNLLSNIKNLRK